MRFQQCAIVILDHVELHSSYTAEPCAWLYFKGEKKASGRVHFEQQYCLDRSKAEFVSDILWPFYPSICNSSSIQATLCLSHSPVHTWSATTMQGFPSHAMGWRRAEIRATIPSILLCPAGCQSRAVTCGRVCVCWSLDASCARAASSATGKGTSVPLCF